MKLMLFLGSGVSYPTGLPGVNAITKSLLEGKWHHATDNRFYPGEGTSRTPIFVLQQFLKLLKSYADGYYALRNGQEANYEDLFFLSQQLADDSNGEVDNPAILGFVSEVKARCETLCRQLRNSHPQESFRDMAELVCNFIRFGVVYSLATNKPPQGMDLVTSLAQSGAVSKLDIVSLNHDLLVEQILQSHGITFQDGFEDREADQVRHFNPTVYEKETKVRLFKLHGSINWYVFDNRIEQVYGISKSGDFQHSTDAHGNYWSTNGVPSLLAGTYNKSTQYGLGPFAEMHFWFHKLLHEDSVIAMSGYGWNDQGINGRLFDWLLRSGGNRLCLMHERPVEIAEKSKSPMWHRYDDLVRDKRLVPINKWMKDVSLEELLARFQ